MKKVLVVLVVILLAVATLGCASTPTAAPSSVGPSWISAASFAIDVPPTVKVTVEQEPVISRELKSGDILVWEIKVENDGEPCKAWGGVNFAPFNGKVSCDTALHCYINGESMAPYEFGKETIPPGTTLIKFQRVVRGTPELLEEGGKIKFIPFFAVEY